MKIALLGASGRTGCLVLATALDNGHDVTALVRNPKAAALPGGLRVVDGDVRDPAALGRAVNGSDVIISALGPRKGDTTLHREITPMLIDAMQAADIGRFVGISGAGIDVAGDQKSGRDKAISWFIQHIGGSAAQDKVLEYQQWAASDLNWTLVRPPRLDDKPATGSTWQDARRTAPSTRISRGDLAHLLVRFAETGEFARTAPFVASMKT